jgi:hypothetical protein
MEPNLNLKIEKVEGNTLTILHGNALPLYYKQGITFEGDIYAPIDFWEKRFEQFKDLIPDCHVEINRDTLTIKLITQESDEKLRNIIIGKVSYFDDYKALRINNDEYWNPIELSNHLKMNRHLFFDKNLGAELITKLQNIKAKVQGDVEKFDNQKGSKKILFEETVKHNIPDGFELEMQVIKGMGKVNFHVEIDVKYMDMDFSVKLISPDLKQAIDNFKEKIISEIEGRFGKDIAILHN